MGFFKSLFGSPAPQEAPKTYSPEEFVVREREQSGERWHVVPLCDLSRLAQTTYRGKSVSVDKYNYLVFNYTSKSGKTHNHAQCYVDENGQLRQTPRGYYPGQ